MRGGLVGDDRGKRRTEHGNGACEDETGDPPPRAGGLEEAAGRVHVHAHPDVELGLGLAADHGGQVEDDVGAVGHPARDRGVR